MKVVPCVARPIINKMFGNNNFLTLYTDNPKGLRQLYDVDVSLTMATSYLGGWGQSKYVRENGLKQGDEVALNFSKSGQILASHRTHVDQRANNRGTTN